jgi:hypothetical protein
MENEHAGQAAHMLFMCTCCHQQGPSALGSKCTSSTLPAVQYVAFEPHKHCLRVCVLAAHARCSNIGAQPMHTS